MSPQQCGLIDEILWNHIDKDCGKRRLWERHFGWFGLWRLGYSTGSQRITSLTHSLTQAEKVGIFGSKIRFMNRFTIGKKWNLITPNKSQHDFRQNRCFFSSELQCNRIGVPVIGEVNIAGASHRALFTLCRDLELILLFSHQSSCFAPRLGSDTLLKIP